MSGTARIPYVLGIDLGSASLGWAAVVLNEDGSPEEILRMGVRVFDPGVAGHQLDILKGQNQSKAVERRLARLQRRQVRRRAARQRELFELLQNHGLLPAYTEQQAQRIASEKKHIPARSEARHVILNELDLQLQAKWRGKMTSGGKALPAEEHVLPYFLRARAFEERLEPHELGRALYNLGQRRGFKSNRKAPEKTQEKQEQGKVKKGIGELGKAIEAAGARTLGEYFSGLDPADPDHKRIRNRYTDRKMFEAEFEAIWRVQATQHPSILTPSLKEKVKHLLYYQRPIARQEHLIGECELEPSQKRAPMACLAAQRFRLLQTVNNLLVSPPGETERSLSDDEHKKLVDELEHEGNLTFGEVRKLLDLGEQSQFNLERGGEKRLPGNRTASQMRSVFGARWDQFSDTERERAVEDWRTAENEEELAQKAKEHWGLSEKRASDWGKSSAEQKYARLSLVAIQKLLRRMEQRVPYQTARDQEYTVRFSGGSCYVLLPPVHKGLRVLRNPAVERALTELRKVINAIVRAYGKPFEIHIELARELKLSLRDREARWKRFRENEERRKALKKKLLEDCGLTRPSPDDIRKAMLWEECQEHCPYTGRHISFCDLFGEHPQFEIEHILPRSRVADNSMNNLTLCEITENRQKKQGKTPWEAYGNTDEWEQITNRVKRMNNSEKLKRFLVKSQKELEGFQARQLNDTAYASKLAAEYLGLLYGGRDIKCLDGTTRQAIHTNSGGVSADLRRGWGLEEILRELVGAKGQDGRGKPRSDHRHHAIDALVVALTTPAAVKALSNTAAQNLRERGRESYRNYPEPWPRFVESVRTEIKGMKVSHRPERKLGGQLHAETYYSNQPDENGKAIVHSRRFVIDLSRPDIEAADVIVDRAVRMAVQKKLEEVGGDPRKLHGAAVPFLLAKDGRKIPIRRVRIRESLKTVPIGKPGGSAQAPPQRYVAPKNNHHAEILAVLDERGGEASWEGKPVSLLAATERRRTKQPVVKREHGAGYEFRFSLMVGDLLELTRNGQQEIHVVRSVAANGQIHLTRHTDARLLKEIQSKPAKETDVASPSGDGRRRREKGTGGLWKPKAETLREFSARKVLVDLLGWVHPAND